MQFPSFIWQSPYLRLKPLRLLLIYVANRSARKQTVNPGLVVSHQNPGATSCGFSYGVSADSGHVLRELVRSQRKANWEIIDNFQHFDFLLTTQ